MSMYMESLFQEAVRQFNSTEDDDRFQKSFVMAANSVFDELSFAAALSTAIGHITRINNTVSELDEEHTAIVLAGLSATLARFGYEHAQGPDAFDRLERRWREMRGNYQVMKSRDDQATQDDDDIPSSDIAGLGYLGDD